MSMMLENKGMEWKRKKELKSVMYTYQFPTMNAIIMYYKHKLVSQKKKWKVMGVT